MLWGKVKILNVILKKLTVLVKFELSASSAGSSDTLLEFAWRLTTALLSTTIFIHNRKDIQTCVLVKELESSKHNNLL